MTLDALPGPDDPADAVEGDEGSTTGTGETGESVGRLAGQDVGYAGETGAERRAEWEKEHGSTGG